jgi:1-pyrroline-5-carboxylate dehydrogenase
MHDGIVHPPPPTNEPVRGYAPGTPNRARLKIRLDAMLREEVEICPIVGGREVRTGLTAPVAAPHDHGHRLAIYHRGRATEVEQAIAAARGAWPSWAATRWEERVAIFLRAAELLAGPRRDTLNAASMLGQSKTVHEAEIDAACELIDFWRFNPHYLARIYGEQPSSSRGVWNTADYRPLEGFVFAVTPFNFTSIGGNLPTAPAMCGNTVLWKPSSTSLLANWYTMKVLEEAGLPPGVINFLPGSGPEVGGPALASPELAGIHFTGSTEVFNGLWKTIGDNIGTYRSYPRIVGETGGKNFVFAHPSAGVPELATALVRGAFEYQGQKCSAAARAYVPKSLWPALRTALAERLDGVTQGPPTDFRNFVAAVIDERSFRRIEGIVDEAKAGGHELIHGGGCDGSTGWFIQPTLLRADDPRSTVMTEEIFGPVLTVFVYDDARLDEAVRLAESTSPYALTGAIFGADRAAVARLATAFRFAAGNLYLNDKPTGAVVGQQPFGGARASGTNDKAGSPLNLMRWLSQRVIKENFLPPTDYRYPFMGEE